MNGQLARRLGSAEAARLLLNPASIAVIGASEDRRKFGGRLYGTLVDQRYPGRLYPVNPRRKELMGIPAFPDVASLPETPDLAVVVLSPDQAVAAVEACAARAVPTGIVIATGFAESGQEGRTYQEALAEIAARTGMRLAGPNCIGVVNTHGRTAPCATAVYDRIPMMPGKISMAAQSGSLLTTVMSRALDEGLPFHYLVSSGNEVDLNVCDFLEVFLGDPRTQIVMLYLEHIRQASRFRLLAQRAREIGKPIVALKVGRSEMGVRAARSHTAAVAGDDAVVEAVLRTDGVIRVQSPEEAVAVLQALALAPRPRGSRMFLMSGSGGTCALLADLAAESGLQLSRLGDQTRAALEPFFEAADLRSFLDVGGVRGAVGPFEPEVVRSCLDIVGGDPDVHGIIFGFTTQPYLVADAREIASFAQRWGKPVLVYGGIGSYGREALDAIRTAGVPLIADAEHCIRAAVALARAAAAPPPGAAVEPAAPPPPVPAGGGPLTEVESKQILAAWGLPLPKEALATSAEEAAILVSQLDRPVAMKVVSPDIAHKTEVGGVRLRVVGPAAARVAYDEIVAGARSHNPRADIQGVLVQEMVSGVEVIVGAKRDPQFGPMVLVGLGGVFVELLKDIALRPAPVGMDEAMRMLSELRGYPLLRGFRGAPPADVEALAKLVSSFSALAAGLADRIDEIDLNPIVVLPEGQGVRIVDALMLRRC